MGLSKIPIGLCSATNGCIIASKHKETRSPFSQGRCSQEPAKADLGRPDHWRNDLLYREGDSESQGPKRGPPLQIRDILVQAVLPIIALRYDAAVSLLEALWRVNNSHDFKDRVNHDLTDIELEEEIERKCGTLSRINWSLLLRHTKKTTSLPLTPSNTSSPKKSRAALPSRTSLQDPPSPFSRLDATEKVEEFTPFGAAASSNGALHTPSRPSEHFPYYSVTWHKRHEHGWENWDQITPSTSPSTPVAPQKKLERKGSVARSYSKVRTS